MSAYPTRTFLLPDGRKVRTASSRRYVVFDTRDGEILYRTDDKGRADAYARRSSAYVVFS